MADDITVSDLILSNLVTNERFVRDTIPYIQSEFFESKIDQAIFNAINQYFHKSNSLINRNILLIEVNEAPGLNSEDLKEAKSKINELCSSEAEKDIKWLTDEAEQWCRDRSMYLAITRAICIYDGTDKEMSPHAIPDLVKQALSVSFKTNIGSDWQDDAESRFDRYLNPENKIPFDLDTLNDITFGGVTKKTLSIILAGVHVGKTLSLVHLAAGYARLGYNVLYLSLEMGEDEILHRIDANMLKVSMHSIKELGKEVFIKRIHHLRSKSYGKIKVIQYPTSLAHCGHFRTVINELSLKCGWRPDVVMVDYVGIVASSRIKVGMTNSHFYLKSVAEELRAMAIELDFVCWSAMQLTRSGMGSSDVEMTDIAESIGIPGVCDFMLAATRNEEMDAVGQISFKQLKNRFRNMIYRPRFILGSEFDQQLLYDVSESEQTLIEAVPSAQISSRDTQSKFEKHARKRRQITIDPGECA
jgi:replicative DNA helicase